MIRAGKATDVQLAEALDGSIHVSLRVFFAGAVRRAGQDAIFVLGEAGDGLLQTGEVNQGNSFNASLEQS
jgi:hypothetical protein